MSNEIWRWADPEGQQRKVQLDELRAALAGGLIAPNTPVWKPGWKGWQAAHEVPELATSALGAANGVVPNIPPPPLAVLSVQRDLEARGAESFRPPPVAPIAGKDDEPPPPPFYVPAATKQPAIPSPDSSPDVSAGAQSPARLPSSLPTTVGLPPPPEIAALAAAKAGSARGRMPSKPPPPVPKRPSASSDPNEMVEELSGSMLLDDASQGVIPNAGPSADGLPPPSDPVMRPVIDPDEAAEPPVVRPNPIDQLKKEIENLRAGRPPENKRLLIVAGVVAFSGVIIVLVVFISLIKAVAGGGSSDKPAGSASATASSEPPASATPVETAAPTTKPDPTPTAVAAVPKEAPTSTLAFGDCTAAGDAKSIGWRAVVPSGIEAASYAGTLAIGFASNPHDGVAVSLDPSTLAASATVKSRAAGGDAKRVTPLLAQGKLAVVADSDRKGDRLVSRRVVGSIPPIDIGVAENAIVWAPHGKDSWAKLFALAGDGPVEALRGVPLATSKGIAVAYRQNGAIYVGVAKGEGVLEAAGALQQIPGLGQVGSPSITATGDALVLAWADRTGAQEPWSVRWTKVPVGGAPEAPRTLSLPEGGLGEQAMSPSVASLGGGRFLLAWTEGPVSSHHVRAQSFNADGPSGAAIAVSPTGTNAGQPQATVGPDGKGLVAFLAAKGKSYEVYAAPLSCPAK